MLHKKVRVRFAPSPTGPLHIGGVRTALFNYLYAKKYDGDFVLRIEDTDAQRFVPGAEEYILQSFQWLGIHFDEGVHAGGQHAPYRQSERKSIYVPFVEFLLEKGLAYIAFDTPEELNHRRESISNFQYDSSTRLSMCNSLTLSSEATNQRIAAGDQYVVRMKIIPGTEIEVIDLIRGKITVQSSLLDDKVLFKSSDGLPTYHLANVVDDHLMEITHVIRGEEWLPSAPLHVLLYRYLGWEDHQPAFAHLPLLLKPEGHGKLSKRDGDRMGFPVFPIEWKNPDGEYCSGFREFGFLPEAVINFLALLGWNPGIDREIFSMKELIDHFSLDRCSKSGAKFDFNKGIWFNHQYIQSTSNSVLASLFLPILKEKGIQTTDEKAEKIIGLVKERINFVNDIWEQTSFFFVAPVIYDEKTVQKRWKENSSIQLTELMTVLKNIDEFTSDFTEAVVKKWIETMNYHTGEIMNALRLTIVGESKGPHLFDIIEIIGKEETLSRLHRAIHTLE